MLGLTHQWSRKLSPVRAYNFDVGRGESADQLQAERAFMEARNRFGNFVCVESLNAATIYGTMPGKPDDKARRLAEVFNWIAARGEEDIKKSAPIVNRSGNALDAKFFPNIAGSEAAIDQRAQLLREQLLECRKSVANKVSEAISFSRNPKVIEQLLVSISPLANPKEMEKWRTLAQASESKK
jgi:hypothetical protein